MLSSSSSQLLARRSRGQPVMALGRDTRRARVAHAAIPEPVQFSHELVCRVIAVLDQSRRENRMFSGLLPPMIPAIGRNPADATHGLGTDLQPICFSTHVTAARHLERLFRRRRTCSAGASWAEDAMGNVAQ